MKAVLAAGACFRLLSIDVYLSCQILKNSCNFSRITRSGNNCAMTTYFQYDSSTLESRIDGLTKVHNLLVDQQIIYASRILLVLYFSIVYQQKDFVNYLIFSRCYNIIRNYYLKLLLVIIKLIKKFILKLDDCLFIYLILTEDLYNCESHRKTIRKEPYSRFFSRILRNVKI